jgi:hypothetical protein
MFPARIFEEAFAKVKAISGLAERKAAQLPCIFDL